AKGKNSIAIQSTIILMFPLATVSAVLIQPIPALAIIQFSYFFIAYLSGVFKKMPIWGKLSLLSCVLISASAFLWIPPVIDVEHIVLVNAYFTLKGFLLQIIFAYIYQNYFERNQHKLKLDQEDLRFNLKHLKIAPWRYSFANRKFKASSLFRSTFGYDEHEILEIEEALINRIPSDCRKSLIQALENPVECRTLDFIYNIDDKGEKIYFHLRGEAFFDEEGKPDEFFGSIEDVSNRMRKTEEIAYSQSLLAATLDSTVNGILVINNRGKVQEYNRKYLEMWETKAEFIEGKKLMELVEEMPVRLENPEIFYQDVEKVLQDNRVETFSEVRLEDGKIFEVHSKPHLHKEKVVGRILSLRDISDQKRDETLLKNNEEKYRTLFESSADGILLLDLEGRKAIDCNEQMLQLFEASREEILNANTLTFSPKFQPDGKSSFEKREEVFQMDKAQSTIGRFEWQYISKSGNSFDAEVIVSPFEFQGKAHAIHIIRDISDRKALMEELEQKNSTLEEKVKERTEHLEIINAELKRSNDDLEQFAYAASHDLKEPLRMVGNFVGLLARDYEENLDPKAHRYIRFATEGVKRMTEQMKGLLEFSLMGRSEMNLKDTDLNTVLNKNVLNLSVFLEEKGGTVHLPENSTQLSCEPVMLGILFHNLISNALKFNKSEQPQVWIKYRYVGAFVKICVRDNGIGISEDNQKKIFEIFKRLHRPNEFEGTGIGLAMCRKIVHRHGGDIWVESELGKGSVFCFTLPSRKLLNQEANMQMSLEH
ncbi:MAG: ATP-binding protein, partial [Bacteroidota bacterium]